MPEVGGNSGKASKRTPNKWVKKIPQENVSLPIKGQLCDILDKFSGTSHFLTHPPSYKNNTVFFGARANAPACARALQVNFITRHYFCSFTLAIHFTCRVKILAPVKLPGPVPVGTDPGFSPAFRMPYHK